MKLFESFFFRRNSVKNNKIQDWLSMIIRPFCVWPLSWMPPTDCNVKQEQSLHQKLARSFALSFVQFCFAASATGAQTCKTETKTFTRKKVVCRSSLTYIILNLKTFDISRIRSHIYLSQVFTEMESGSGRRWAKTFAILLSRGRLSFILSKSSQKPKRMNIFHFSEI